MSRWWIVPVSLAVVMYFGMFWTLALSDMDIDISMDNNTRDAIEAISKLKVEPVTVYNSTVIIYQGNLSMDGVP